jgi:hydroxymethylglutaryl-CoA lyase
LVNIVNIVEVGPRDGLQNEAKIVPTSQKVGLIDKLSQCGFKRIEVTSFVSSRRVPQMSDADRVMDRIFRVPGVSYGVLTPNLRGARSAIRAGADEIALFTAASEAFSRKNIQCSIAESLERFGPVVDLARSRSIPVRGYVSTIIECPWSGLVTPDAVATVCQDLVELGCDEISLGDTTGKATPEQVERLLRCVLERFPAALFAGHFHDTAGRALDNIGACLSLGLRAFDASVAGLGGCPFAPGAPGNVATEAVCAFVEGLGYETGIDRNALQDAVKLANKITQQK